MATDLNQATATTAEGMSVGTPTIPAVNTPAANTPTPEQNNAAGQQPNTQPYRLFTTQEEFDRHAAGIKGSAKREVEKEILSAFGLKPEEKEKLQKIKEAYEKTLTHEEKENNELERVQSDLKTCQAQLEESKYVIVALCKATGKTVEDISKVVRMAKGLVDESTTIEDAIDQVMKMIPQQQPQQQTPAKPIVPEKLEQPNTPAPEINPFIRGEHFNLTQQGLLIKNDPEKARKLMRAAGIKNINF